MAWITPAAAALVLLVFFWRGWFRLPEQPRWPAALSPAAGFGLAAAMLLAGLAGTGIAAGLADVSGRPENLDTYARLAAGRYLAQAGVALLVVVMVARAARPRSDRRLAPAVAAALAAAALAAAWPVIQTVAAAAARAQSMLTDAVPDEVAHETLKMIVDSPHDAWFWLTLVLVVVGPALMEEVTYRGLVQRTLREVGVPAWGTIGLTSVLFVVMHVSAADVYALAPLLVLSLCLGWCYEKTGRLAGPMVMHGAFNGVNLLLALG